MNKTAIKNFAVWARNKLIADITYKAGLLGITEKEVKSALPQSTKDVQFFNIGTKEPYSISGIEIKQRDKLAETIKNKEKKSDYETAYKAVVEEVAYTWFNRLIAVRFMEVNEYLPSRIRVLSSESANKTEPDLVTTPFETGLDFTPYEKDRIVQLTHETKLDELFRMLFIKQCNALNAILPNLFEKTSDYTELLLNVSFTDKDGVVYHLVHDIPEDDFNISKEGQIEIIGWLYQYYNTEPKDEAFALLKKNVKITKERIPAATQLFTPDWIVRYMVENSLGRLWLEGHPNDTLKSEWKYYLEEAEQEVNLQKQLNAIREEYKTVKPEEIKVIDPCMGSGHILVYAFDVLMKIYASCGYAQRDAAKSIVENNLYGLDIDNRAYQLAYFAVMMKSRQYNRRILNGETNCHVYAIQESNDINREHLKYFGVDMIDIECNTALNQMQYLLDTFIDAKEYGSILNVDNCDWRLLHLFTGKVDLIGQISMDSVGIEETQKQLRQLICIAATMAQEYDVVMTNPPYMGSGGMNTKLTSYVKKQYQYTKSDMSTVFMEKALIMCNSLGYVSMINIPVWMFLSTYEKLRNKIISQNTFINMIHSGRGIFGSDFGSTAFIINKSRIEKYIAKYCQLFNDSGAVDSVEQKEMWFFEEKGRYHVRQEDFEKIPGVPIAYWAGERTFAAFQTENRLGQYDAFHGVLTGNDEMFIRSWYEIDVTKIGFNLECNIDSENSDYKFFPLNKGGSYRKWYGNNQLVIWFDRNGREKIKTMPTNGFGGKEKYFCKGITWNEITTGPFSARYAEKGSIFSLKGPSIFPDESNIYLVLGYLCSNTANYFLKIMNPSISCGTGVVIRLPYINFDSVRRDNVESLVKENIEISKADWDSSELSWNFAKHFLVSSGQTLSENFSLWEKRCTENYMKIITNEGEINRIFIDAFSIHNEISPSVIEKDISLKKADIKQDIRSFISYAIGCLLGRYSLDVEGLVYAGGEWDVSKYSTYIPDKDNILPITDEEYFEDDIVGLFVAFVKKVHREETLEENLDFVAKALGNKGNSSREIIRNYFLKDFFKDHCKTYQKRPIYWLFDSGKADGFKALIYMHRYDENTIGNLRIDYLHRMQRVYDSEIARMQETIENSSNAREVTAAEKRKEKLTKQLKETKEYDEKIAHLALARISIDLDDGVVVNYEKVQTGTDGKKQEVLAKI